MKDCKQELCPNWSGDGDVCPCAIFGLPDPERQHSEQVFCRHCGREIQRHSLVMEGRVGYWVHRDHPTRMCSGATTFAEPRDDPCCLDGECFWCRDERDNQDAS